MKYLSIAFNFLACLTSFAQTPSCIWAFREGSTGYDWANSIAIDKSGSNSLYVTGPFTSASITIGPSTIFNSSAGTMDAMLIKFDYNGNPIWAVSAGSNLDDFLSMVDCDTQGNAYISGSFSGSSITFGSTTINNTVTGKYDGFFAKYDSSGIFQWALITGGDLYEYLGNMEIDQAGNIYLAGTFSSDSLVLGPYTLYKSGPNQITDKFMIKMDPGGNILWATLTSIFGPMTLDNQGNLFMGGNMPDSVVIFGNDTLINNGVGSNDIFIAKFDTAGNPLWAQNAGGTGGDGCYAIATDDSGNVCITGNFLGPTITFGPYTLFHPGNRGMYLVKYDTFGNVIWAVESGGIGDCAGHGLAIDSSGTIYVAGEFGSYPVSFGSNNLTSSGLWDIFIASFDSGGNPIWATSAGGTDFDYTNALAMDEFGNAYIGGTFHSTVCTFNTFTLTSAGESDLFLAKYSNDNLNIDEISAASLISVYPNPTSSVVSISIHKPNVNQVSMLLRNILGQEVFKLQENNFNSIYSKSIDLSEFPNGIYLLDMNVDGERLVMKIIKE